MSEITIGVVRARACAEFTTQFRLEKYASGSFAFRRSRRRRAHCWGRLCNRHRCRLSWERTGSFHAITIALFLYAIPSSSASSSYSTIARPGSMVEFVRIIRALLHAEGGQNNRRGTSFPHFPFSFSYPHLWGHASRSLLLESYKPAKHAQQGTAKTVLSAIPTATRIILDTKQMMKDYRGEVTRKCCTAGGGAVDAIWGAMEDDASTSAAAAVVSMAPSLASAFLLLRFLLFCVSLFLSVCAQHNTTQDDEIMIMSGGMFQCAKEKKYVTPLMVLPHHVMLLPFSPTRAQW